jgi:peptidoglycan-associated lipoprotein
MIGLVLVVAACGKKAPEVAPDPNAGAPGTAPTRPAPSTPDEPRRREGAGVLESIRAQLIRELETQIHFDFDRDEIRQPDATILDRKAAIMLANPALRIRIAGHADERGSDEYNLVLGNKRAAAAKRYLEAKGVDGSRIDIVSFGEERAVDSASTEEAWAKNRRDEFEITAGADRLVSPQ